MIEHYCRACHGTSGQLVLDLGQQPASDYFPLWDDPGPDPVYPLQMWLCSYCGLAQLLADPTVPEEPRGAEPAALVAQAEAAVARVGAAGLLPRGALVAEYGSPHGGSWLPLLTHKELRPAAGTEQADVVLDCFGLMHAADQAAALSERTSKLTADGVLLVQFHSLEAILRHGQWNALRHGHYAYYSVTALTAMLMAVGFTPRTAWQFDLYGGTVLLAADRGGGEPDACVLALLKSEAVTGVRDPTVLRGLEDRVQSRAKSLHGWLAGMKASGRTVVGYGAASRAVALLRTAGIERDLLAAVADASPAKNGRRVPGTDIPVIPAAELTERAPDAVLVFVSDLIEEVRATYPEIEERGGQWIAADAF
jgi:hypothetical protein